MAVIFKLSSEGHDASTARSDAIVHVIRAMGVVEPTSVLQFLTRKAAHTVAYMVLGGLAFNVVRQHGMPMRRTVAISILIPIVYAMTDEFHQRFIAGRSSELRDVLIDSTAAVIGVAIAYSVMKSGQSRRRRKMGKL